MSADTPYMCLLLYHLYNCATSRNSRQNSKRRRGNRKAARWTPYIYVSDTLQNRKQKKLAAKQPKQEMQQKGRASGTLCVCLAPSVGVVSHLLDVLSDMSVCKQLPLLLLLCGCGFSLFCKQRKLAANQPQQVRQQKGCKSCAFDTLCMCCLTPCRLANSGN